MNMRGLLAARLSDGSRSFIAVHRLKDRKTPLPNATA
jgi:hypothetical protein